MRDMYEIMDRWGAWAASDNSGLTGNPLLLDLKAFTSWKENTPAM